MLVCACVQLRAHILMQQRKLRSRYRVIKKFDLYVHLSCTLYTIRFDSMRLCIGISEVESSVDLLNMSLYTLLPIILSNWVQKTDCTDREQTLNFYRHAASANVHSTAQHSLCVCFSCACNLLFLVSSFLCEPAYIVWRVHRNNILECVFTSEWE